MKKEKQVKTYKRRTKSGKMVTVKAHTAKYDAAEMAKELAKKKGAGNELEERKKKTTQLDLPFDWDEADEKKILDEVKESSKKESSKKTKEPKEKSKKSEKAPKKAEKSTEKKEPKSTKDVQYKAKSAKSESGQPFTAAEFKEWYQGTGSAADKKVAKALRAQLGRSGYKKLEDEAIDNYSSRGHLKMFKSLGNMGEEVKSKPKDSTTKTGTKVSSSKSDAKSLKKEIQSNEKKVESYAKKHNLVYEEDGVYSNKKGQNFVLNVEGGKVVKQRVNDHLTADYETQKKGVKTSSKKSTKAEASKEIKTELPKTPHSLKEGTYNLGNGFTLTLSKDSNGKWKGEAYKDGKKDYAGSFHYVSGSSSTYTHKWLGDWKKISDDFAKMEKKRMANAKRQETLAAKKDKPTSTKPSKLSAVERAYAEYHKEQGRKGKPNYSSEEFADFAALYKHHSSQKKGTKTPKTASKRPTKVDANSLRDSEGKVEKGKNYFIGSNGEVHIKASRPSAKKITKATSKESKNTNSDNKPKVKKALERRRLLR